MGNPASNDLGQPDVVGDRVALAMFPVASIVVGVNLIFVKFRESFHSGDRRRCWLTNR